MDVRREVTRTTHVTLEKQDLAEMLLTDMRLDFDCEDLGRLVHIDPVGAKFRLTFKATAMMKIVDGVWQAEA